MLGRIRWIRVLGIAAIAGLLLLGSGTVLPVPPGADAMTLCYPVIGPVTRFDRTLADTVRRRVDAHEAAHRADCRRLGAIRHYAALVGVRGRMAAEARAGCAEARGQITAGANPYLELERLVDELRYTSRAFEALGDSVIRGTVAGTCPDVAKSGQEPPWQRKQPARRELSRDLLTPNPQV